MKFQFIHKIAVIHEMFIMLVNLLRGLDMTHSGAGSGPRVVGEVCIPILGNLWS